MKAALLLFGAMAVITIVRAYPAPEEDENTVALHEGHVSAALDDGEAQAETGDESGKGGKGGKGKGKGGKGKGFKGGKGGKGGKGKGGKGGEGGESGGEES